MCSIKKPTEEPAHRLGYMLKKNPNNPKHSRAYKTRVINCKSPVKSTRWEFFQKYLRLSLSFKKSQDSQDWNTQIGRQNRKHIMWATGPGVVAVEIRWLKECYFPVWKGEMDWSRWTAQKLISWATPNIPSSNDSLKSRSSTLLLFAYTTQWQSCDYPYVCWRVRLFMCTLHLQNLSYSRTSWKNNLEPPDDLSEPQPI